MNIKQLVEKNTILKIKSGSQLYGTNTENSDLDFIGVCIMPKDYILGVHKFDLLELRTNPSNSNKINTKADNDCTIYSIQKYFKLLYDGNPNVLETLFVNTFNIVSINNFGEIILQNRDIFLSKQAYFKFRGYANAQKRKLITKQSIGLRKALVDMYGWDVKYGAHLIRLLYFGIELWMEWLYFKHCKVDSL